MASVIGASDGRPSHGGGLLGRSLVVVATTVVLLLAMCVFWPARRAMAASSRPSVLLVDGNLRDLELTKLHWLGDDASVVAEDRGYALYSSVAPTWWSEAQGEGEAPSTFVLGCPEQNVPLDASRIVWALDQIRASGNEPKTFVIGVGPAGLPIRQYVEDLATTKQSSRADVVGLAMLGVPHNGYTATQLYPECGIWSSLSDATDFTLDDITPGSNRLTELNSHAFPRVLKTFNVYGNVGDLGFGNTDGAAVVSDLMLPESVSKQVQTMRSDTTISQQINLTGLWAPLTSSIDYPGRTVDAKLTERLSGMSSYPLSPEVRKEIKSFYDVWYANGAPVTHGSDALLVDLSGSMNEDIEGGVSKLDAAKQALKEYLHVTEVCASMPLSAPMDVSMTGFAEQVWPIAGAYDEASRNAVDGMSANGETNIGIALERALATLGERPTCATKHILLLSDGAATRGLSEDAMLSGPVAQAKKAGIAIDCIGFGNVGESNEAFLKRVSEVTGGTYFKVGDAYGLRVNFMKSFYDTLGVETADGEISQGSTDSGEICTTDEYTNSIEATVVSAGNAPSVALLCDGNEVAEEAVSVKTSGSLVTIQCDNPQQGSYSIRLADGSSPRHWFSCKQQGVPQVEATASNQTDVGAILVIIVAAVAVVSIVATVIWTITRMRA